MGAFCDPVTRRMYADEKRFKVNAVSSGYPQRNQLSKWPYDCYSYKCNIEFLMTFFLQLPPRIRSTLAAIAWVTRSFSCTYILLTMGSQKRTVNNLTAACWSDGQKSRRNRLRTYGLWPLMWQCGYYSQSGLVLQTTTSRKSRLAFL